MGVDKATRAVLKDLSSEPALTRGSDDIAAVRATYDRVFSSWTVGAAAPTREDWVKIESGSQRTSALIVEPLRQLADCSILFIHGGGWSLGSALSYAPLSRVLSAETGMRVITPDFPQAPENPFPAAFDLLADVTTWAAGQFGGSLFFAGDSAGGALAAALSADARVAQLVKAQALFYPVLDLRPTAKYRSRRRFGSGKFFLSEAGILGAAAWYCGNDNDPADPRISPILEPNLIQLPPTFILLPDFDPLKDEGLKYADALRKSGVHIELVRAKNTIHGCVSFSGRIPEGREAIRQAARFFKSLV